MERSGPHPIPGPGAARSASADCGSAGRDAAAILARAAADETAADEVRERYRVAPPAPIIPDGRVATILGPGEIVVATRASAVLERREPRGDGGATCGLGGDLVVTSRRLLLLGRARVAIDLADIDDAVLSGERLLVVLRDGRGLSIETSMPRLLRVEIAAARASGRA